MRVYGEQAYGIPPEQIIGSSLATKYQIEHGNPELMRLPKLFLNCHFGGLVIAIGLFIGKRPYASFGNSTGRSPDAEMDRRGSTPTDLPC
jgi:hypothetical protein